MTAEHFNSQNIKRFLTRFETQRLVEAFSELERTRYDIFRSEDAARKAALLKQYMAGYPGEM